MRSVIFLHCASTFSDFTRAGAPDGGLPASFQALGVGQNETQQLIRQK